MKIAYFDCFSGASGNMILGALLDAGLKRKELESELAKLKLSGYKINVKKITKEGISATRFNVSSKEQQTKRRLKDITRIISASRLGSKVKALSRQTFEELARVEAGIHGVGRDQVHFHELGAIDSIIDIVGAFAGLQRLGIDAVYASQMHLGSGFLECRHGTLPVPAPATAALLKGVPVYSRGIASELVTPTGAAILKSCAQGFGAMPAMNIESIGYGAGDKQLPIPNLLRLCTGEAASLREYDKDEAVLIETNIDDMQPQIFSYVCGVLKDQGALDVYRQPIYMKKNRIGTLLSVLTAEDKFEQALAAIFAQTSALGVRVSRLERYKLFREVISVKTRFGQIKVKVGKVGNKIKNITPEYESCKEISTKKKLPLKDVYAEAVRAAYNILK
jgi:uncharacterized protein (TIGR00299 family) protein